MTLVKKVLRLASTIVCLIVIASFVMFAVDEAQGGTKSQVNKIEGNVNGAAPPAQTERQREKQHGKVREKIDDANDVLTQPFSGIVTSGSVWAQRGVALVLALLVYGLLARILIGYLPGRG